MSDSKDPHWRATWLIPPVVIGVLVLFYTMNGKPAPARATQHERAHTVRVVVVQKVDLKPVAEGYGAVQPERVWAAVAQVAGRMI
jgi:hypothetical protein